MRFFYDGYLNKNNNNNNNNKNKLRYLVLKKINIEHHEKQANVQHSPLLTRLTFFSVYLIKKKKTNKIIKKNTRSLNMAPFIRNWFQ